jgi:Ca2+-binding EF-hand superfamily protein
VARLWSDADLRAMHSLYDPSGRGVINRAQLATAMRNLGIRSTNLPQSGSDSITTEAFIRLARQAIDSEG